MDNEESLQPGPVERHTGGPVVASNVGRQVSLCCPAYVTSSRTPAYPKPLHRPRQRPIYIALSWPRDGHETQKPACYISPIHAESIRPNIYCVFSGDDLSRASRTDFHRTIYRNPRNSIYGQTEWAPIARAWDGGVKIWGASKFLAQPRYIDSERFSSSSLLLAVNKKCHDDEKLIELRKRLATYNWRRPGISAVPGQSPSSISRLPIRFPRNARFPIR